MRTLPSVVKIAVAGCAGRMGQEVLRCAARAPHYEITGGTVHGDSPDIGKDLGQLIGNHNLDILTTFDLRFACRKADVLIDFTAPAAVGTNVEIASQINLPYVAGMTGLQPKDHKALERAGEVIPVLYSENMSFGINLLDVLLEKIAKTLYESDYDIELHEKHHRFKEDSPSGTALRLADTCAKAVGLNHHQVVSGARSGVRDRKSIGVSVSRGGNIPGEHSVSFFGPEEEITFSHRAYDRRLFAQGALKASQWIIHQKPGLYTMKDMFSGLSKEINI